MIGVRIEGPARNYAQYLGKNTFVVDHAYWSDCEPEPGPRGPKPRSMICRLE